MKVGDYVRKKSGYLRKIIAMYNGYVEVDDKCFNSYANAQIENEDIIKSSPNIIDLIEVGDYVNGVLVESIYQREKDKLYIHSFDTEIMMCFTNNNINSIVTHEQFEAMQYKVGE